MATAEHAFEIISRKDAIVQGLKTFFMGVPCKRGHVDLRLISGNCRECARLRSLHYKNEHREELNLRNREWRKNNPAEAAELDKQEYAKRREHHKARRRKYYANNREKSIKYSREYFWINRDKLNTKARERTKIWIKNNPEKARVAVRNYKARKRGNGGKHTEADLQELMRLQKGRCAFCRVSFKKATRNVDHIIPLARGGRNDKSNLQLLCEPCNLRKGARDQIEVVRSMGMLL